VAEGRSWTTMKQAYSSASNRLNVSMLCFAVKATRAESRPQPSNVPKARRHTIVNEAADSSPSSGGRGLLLGTNKNAGRRHIKLNPKNQNPPGDRDFDGGICPRLPLCITPHLISLRAATLRDQSGWTVAGCRMVAAAGQACPLCDGPREGEMRPATKHNIYRYRDRSRRPSTQRIRWQVTL